MKSELATHEDNLPDIYDFGDDAGAGLEDPRLEEMKTPFLYVVQAGSKIVNPGLPQFIEGAQAGMLFNSSSKRLYDGKRGIDMVACARGYKFTEWVPLDGGGTGGFKGEHSPDDPFIRELIKEQGRFKKLDTHNGTELIETFELYALIGPPGFTVETLERVVIPFTSIKIDRFKLFYDAARNIQYRMASGVYQKPAIYMHRWRISTVFESRWAPNGAWNINIGLAGGSEPIRSLLRRNDPVFDAAVDFYNLVKSGKVEADYAKDGSEQDPPF